jgi:LPXTG-motif cell wall-anchored protein
MVTITVERHAKVTDEMRAGRRLAMRNLTLLGAMFVLPWLLVAAFGARYVEGATLAQAGATNFTVVVGNPIYTDEGGKPTWQGQNFYPGTLTVNAGDSVTWQFDAGNEPHTVTFMGPVTGPIEAFIPDPASGPPQPGAPPKLIANPQAQLPQGTGAYDGSAFTSSGLVAADIPGPKEYTLTFPKPGTYQYICLLHAFPGPGGQLVGMIGTITVQAGGSAYPQTPEQVLAAGKEQRDEEAARAKTLEAEMAAHAMPPTALPDGTMKHHVEVGGMDMQANLEYHRFTPKTLNIKQGDTVEWSMAMPGFHTVTFGDEPEMFTIESQQAGPPKLVLNPQLFPSGGAEHTGTGYYNSGPLASPNQPPDPMFVTSYALKFAQPGRYEYICIPHYPMGMDATVIVEAASAGAVEAPPAAAPETAVEVTAPTADGADAGMPSTGAETNWLVLVLVGGALFALAGAAVRLRLRKGNRLT